MSDLPVDSIFAGYRIERVLGSGGMGSVYLARNPDLPRSEAMKVLSVELSRDPAFRARFVREADLAASLDHPNIVSVHQRGEFDGKLWIAMQYVAGTDAEAAVRAGTMNPPRALRIITEVGKALDYAHHRGVVHRDIKPANFLLSQSVGGDERVLLADFGIARALGDAGLTSTGTVMATLAYAAPEVLAGHPSDGRADLYSLGCSLYHLLTGKSPYFQADGAAAVMAAHLTKPPPRVTEVAPWLPPQLDWVIAKAMAKDPGQRFSTARDLADAARHALYGTDIAQQYGRQAAPPTAPVRPNAPPTQVNPQWQPNYLVAPPDRRHAKTIAAIAAVLVVIAGSVTAWALTSGSDSTPSASTSSTSQSATTSAKPVPNASLSGLLLTPAEAAETVGVPELVVSKTLNAIQDDSSGTVDPRDCVSADLPAQVIAYRGTGWKAAVEQFLTPPAGAGTFAAQTVVSFPDSAAAEKVVRDQRLIWGQCAGKSVQVTANGTTFTQTIGSVANIGDTAIALAVKRADGFDCQRALGVQNNVVVDVIACRIGVVSQGADMLKQIVAKIPT
jgi:serine/threonine-protein kinase